VIALLAAPDSALEPPKKIIIKNTKQNKKKINPK
jgi:hypothetical protein